MTTRDQLQQKQAEAWTTMFAFYDFSYRWTSRDSVLFSLFGLAWFSFVPLALLGY